MSRWKEVLDSDDIEIEGNDVQVYVGRKAEGNIYVHFKTEMIIGKLKESGDIC